MTEFFRLQSWDFGCSATKKSDFSVCSSWEWRSDAKSEPGAYLRHLWRGRLEFTALKQQVVMLAAEFRPDVILLENKVSGMAMLQELRATTMLPVMGVNPTQDKVTRVLGILPWFEAGRVFFRAGANWLGELEAELLSFPHGAYDDQVDSLVQALAWLKQREQTTTAGLRRL